MRLVLCWDIAHIRKLRYNPNMAADMVNCQICSGGLQFNLVQRHSLSLGWIVDPLKSPPSSSRPRTPGSQSGNRGSNPLGGIPYKTRVLRNKTRVFSFLDYVATILIVADYVR